MYPAGILRGAGHRGEQETGAREAGDEASGLHAVQIGRPPALLESASESARGAGGGVLAAGEMGFLPQIPLEVCGQKIIMSWAP